MMSKKFVKIMCIFLAALMLLSVVAVALNVFAASAQTMTIANTGDTNTKNIIIIVAIVAVVILLVVGFLPTILKKIKK